MRFCFVHKPGPTGAQRRRRATKQLGGRKICFSENSSGMVNRESVVMVNRYIFVVVNRESVVMVKRHIFVVVNRESVVMVKRYVFVASASVMINWN